MNEFKFASCRDPCAFDRYFQPSSGCGFSTSLSPLKVVPGFPAMELKDFGKGGRGSPALPYVLLAGNRSHRGDDGSCAMAQGADTRLPPELGRALLAASERCANRGVRSVIRPDVMPHPHLPVNCGKHMGKSSTGRRPIDHSKRFQAISCFQLPNVATMYIICRLPRQCPFAYSSDLQHLCLTIPFSGYRPLPVFRLAPGALAARGVRSFCNFARKRLL